MLIKSTAIEDFLNFSDSLNVIISVNSSDSVLLALNNISMPDEFNFKVRDMCTKAISLFSDTLMRESIKPEYFRVLINRIRDKLSCFCYEDDILTYSRTYIVDKQHKRFNYDDLTDNIKRELSELFDILRNELMHFKDTISHYSTEKPGLLKFKGSKNVLVAVAAVWYESDLFDVDRSMFSRNDFIKEILRLFGLTDDNPSKTIDKIKNKSNPLEFLDDIIKIGKKLFLPGK